MPYHCSSCKEEHETGKVCDKPMLVQAEGVNWQSCQEGHPMKIICPYCDGQGEYEKKVKLKKKGKKNVKAY